MGTPVRVGAKFGSLTSPFPRTGLFSEASCLLKRVCKNWVFPNPYPFLVFVVVCFLNILWVYRRFF